MNALKMQGDRFDTDHAENVVPSARKQIKYSLTVVNTEYLRSRNFGVSVSLCDRLAFLYLNNYNNLLECTFL